MIVPGFYMLDEIRAVTKEPRSRVWRHASEGKYGTPIKAGNTLLFPSADVSRALANRTAR